MYDIMAPPTIDGLVYAMDGWKFGMFNGAVPTRDEKPLEIRLPFRATLINDRKIYHASALLPDDPQEEEAKAVRELFCKKGEQKYRPIIMVCQKLIGYCVLDVSSKKDRNPNRPAPVGEFKRSLRRFYQNMGKGRQSGHGTLLDITAERIDDDYSLIKDGKAMRWMPDPTGWRVCRVRPPYWSQHGTTTVCEIGDDYILSDK